MWLFQGRSEKRGAIHPRIAPSPAHAAAFRSGHHGRLRVTGFIASDRSRACDPVRIFGRVGRLQLVLLCHRLNASVLECSNMAPFLCWRGFGWRWPKSAAHPQSWGDRTCIVDGQLTACDEYGLPNFQLMSRTCHLPGFSYRGRRVDIGVVCSPPGESQLRYRTLC
jgi:hypothetical protein